MCCSFSTMLHALFIQCLTCHHNIKVMDQVRLDRVHFNTSFGAPRTLLADRLNIIHNVQSVELYACPPIIFFNRCGVVLLCR